MAESGSSGRENVKEPLRHRSERGPAQAERPWPIADGGPKADKERGRSDPSSSFLVDHYQLFTQPWDTSVTASRRR